ncbi:MAG: DUF1616 domain-containing protein [Candidatus Heimdallarchaeota archaeon]|nr:DUF1616 domain-containing protein [Candidatus Heimdallarchaeota archaeon]MCK4953804.1 DUF1616 domain-containing protein [Candidatus Heimdallarchaeota archaeon]
MSNYDKSETRKEIQKILVEEKPKTVRELVKKTVVTTGKEKEEIYQIVKKLEKERIIKLGSQKVDRTLPTSISEYLFKIHFFSIEFWSILLLTCIFFPIIILINPESPFLFLRVIWGLLFGLFIPGWTITNLIFPKVFELIDQFERALIAIGVNIGISIFTGLILNNVWIIDSIPFTITIGILTFVILILSVILRILIGSNKIQFKMPKIKLFKKKK